MSRLTRNLIACLVVSVIVNVFFAGLWAGRFMRRAGRGFGPEISETDSAPMRGIWKKRDALLRSRGEAVDAARRLVREALAAEPFNPEALESALAGLRAETGAAQIALHRALVDAAREQSPSERRRLADSGWFLRGGPHRRPGGR